MAENENKFVTDSEDLVVFFDDEWLPASEIEVVDGVVQRKTPKENSE